MVEPQLVDGSSMIVKKSGGGVELSGMNQNVNMEQGRQESMKNFNKEEPWCSYCKKACHDKPQGLNWGGGVKGWQQCGQANFVNGDGPPQGTKSSINGELGEFKNLKI